MRALQWLAAWMSAAPTLFPAEADDGRRERQAASLRHARTMARTQTKALDLIDRQEGAVPPMDAIEAMLRGEETG